MKIDGRWFIGAGLVAALVACKGGGNDAPPAGTSPPAQQQPQGQTPAQQPNPQAAPQPASPTPAPAGVNGKSAVPTMPEWSAAPEVTVRGSTALNCETKMVREWLRVSCRDKNSTGGKPTTVVVTKGNRTAEVFTFASNGVTSLVMPFVEGTDLEATFSWSDGSHKFTSTWPRGVPQPPPAKGQFD